LVVSIECVKMHGPTNTKCIPLFFLFETFSIVGQFTDVTQIESECFLTSSIDALRSEQNI